MCAFARDTYSWFMSANGSANFFFHWRLHGIYFSRGPSRAPWVCTAIRSGSVPMFIPRLETLFDFQFHRSFFQSIRSFLMLKCEIKVQRLFRYSKSVDISTNWLLRLARQSKRNSCIDFLHISLLLSHWIVASFKDNRLGNVYSPSEVQSELKNDSSQ